MLPLLAAAPSLTHTQGYSINHVRRVAAHPRRRDALPRRLCPDRVADGAGVLGGADWVVVHQRLLQPVSLGVWNGPAWREGVRRALGPLGHRYSQPQPASPSPRRSPRSLGADPSHLEKLNTICLYWTAGAVIIIIITLLVRADHRNSGKFAFSHVSGRGRGLRLERVRG